MRRFELGMNINYAKDWTVVDAVREFYQNAFDEERENPENTMDFNYDESTQIITVSNKKSKLTPKTLLLGESSKRGKSGLIGQHGEGYKVATVVLMRNGITVKIYNNENKEVWTSNIVKSRRYDAEIVVYDIEKKIFNKDSNLVIELIGITPKMYKNIVKSNLHLQNNIGETKEGGKGRVLLDPKYSGCIFVEGLYVCHKDLIKWGYDFSADVVSLDRDRGLVDTINIKFVIAKLVMSLNDNEFIAKNIDNPDIQYINVYIYGGSGFDLSERVYNDFVEKYGRDAIPVSSDGEYNLRASMGMKPVMVSSNIKDIIDYNDRVYEPILTSKTSTDDKFEEWLKESEEYLPSRLYLDIIKLWKEKGEESNDRDNTSG